MATPTPFKVLGTLNRIPITETFHPGFRTLEQFEAVRAITSNPEYDFTCYSESVFSPTHGSTKYQGTFVYTYFTKDGLIHGAKITPKGKVKIY